MYSRCHPLVSLWTYCSQTSTRRCRCTIRRQSKMRGTRRFSRTNAGIYNFCYFMCCRSNHIFSGGVASSRGSWTTGLRLRCPTTSNTEASNCNFVLIVLYKLHLIFIILRRCIRDMLDTEDSPYAWIRSHKQSMHWDDRTLTQMLNEKVQ